MSWYSATAILVVLSSPLQAALAACPVPNPNEVAPPFVADCPLPAAALNRLAPSASPTLTGSVNIANMFASGSITADQLLAPVPVSVSVAIGGTDAGNCQSSPCATMTYAINQAQNGRLTNGQIVLVNLGAGTYNETVNLRGPSSNRAVATHDNIGLINTDNNMVVVQGAGSSLTVWNGSTGVCGTVIVENAAVIGIARVTVKGTNNVCQSSLFAQISGVINVYGNDVVFDSASVEQIHVENLGQVEIWGNIYLTGTSQRFIGGGSNGTVIYSAFPSGVITTVGSPIYTREFVFLQTGAEAQFNLGTSFAGTGVIGKRFTVLRGAELLDSGNSLTFLPGTIAGEQSQGGIYVGPVNNYSVNARAGGTLSIVGGWPTSCSGLASGTLWNNGGVINVCP